MLCLAHFCEVHGPSSILTSQLLNPKEAKYEIPAVSTVNQHKTCQSCQLLLPTGSQSSASSTYSLSNKNSSNSGPQAHCLKTRGPNNNTTILSSQYPASQGRYSAIRQACVKALSSEHTFSDNTPMMYSDKIIGTAIILIFQLEDSASRGRVRKYALICLGEDESGLMRRWSTIAPQLESIANSIKLRAAIQLKKEAQNSLGHERYLRKRDVSSKSLITILKDDRLFIEIHSKFARILAAIH